MSETFGFLTFSVVKKYLELIFTMMENDDNDYNLYLAVFLFNHM